jgi:hypothetical protein
MAHRARSAAQRPLHPDSRRHRQRRRYPATTSASWTMVTSSPTAQPISRATAPPPRTGTIHRRYHPHPPDTPGMHAPPRRSGIDPSDTRHISPLVPNLRHPTMRPVRSRAFATRLRRHRHSGLHPCRVLIGPHSGPWTVVGMSTGDLDRHGGARAAKTNECLTSTLIDVSSD